MDERKTPFTKREATAVFFAAALAGARDQTDTRDVPPSFKHNEIITEAFSLADSFLDAAEDQERWRGTKK